MEITESMRHEESANRWSLLPNDILHKILEKLWFLDRVHAVATCKNWNIPIPATSKYLPWLIEQDWSVVTCSNGRQKLHCKLNLYEALNPKAYPPICRIFDLGWKPPAERINVVEWTPAEVLHTKLGWVLVEIRMICPQGRSSLCFLVLYNPFVRSFRFLPASEIPKIHTAAFSRPPTSSDCVVYALAREDYRSRPFLRIDSYRSCADRTKWKVATYRIQYDSPYYDNHMLLYNSAVVMEDGTLYFLARRDSWLSSSKASNLLIVFNSSDSIKLKNWIKLQNISEPLVGLDDDMDIREAQLAEHEGELFLVCCCRSWGTSLLHHMIYRYNKSANSWSFKQRSDHQKSEFVNDDESYKSTSVTTPGHPVAMRIGNVWEMEGRFWCFQNGPNHRAIEKLFPSYQLYSFSKDVYRPYWKLQWLSLGQPLAPSLDFNGTNTINGTSLN